MRGIFNESEGSLSGRGDDVTLVLGEVGALLVDLVVRTVVGLDTGLVLLDTGETKQTNIALRLEHHTSLPLRAARVVTKDSVELVKRLELGLGDEEDDVGDGGEAHEAEEDEHAVRSGSDEVRRRHGNSKVVEPV